MQIIGGIKTATQDALITRPVIVSNSSASTGTLTVQLRVGLTWNNPAVLGVVAPGSSQKIDGENLHIRFLVAGAVSYEVL